MGSSKRDFVAFPDRVKSVMGYALGPAQFGASTRTQSPGKGEAPGVFEIVDGHDGDA